MKYDDWDEEEKVQYYAIRNAKRVLALEKENEKNLVVDLIKRL